MKHTKLPLTYEDAKQHLVEMLPDEPDMPELIWFLALNLTEQAIHRVLRQADQHERLVEALKDVRDKAFSPRDDDTIWMDDNTPLGLFIDAALEAWKAGR